MIAKNLSNNVRVFIKVIAELSDKDRDILIKRFAEGQSLKEVAQIYGVTNSAIKEREDNAIRNIDETFDFLDL